MYIILVYCVLVFDVNKVCLFIFLEGVREREREIYVYYWLKRDNLMWKLLLK